MTFHRFTATEENKNHLLSCGIQITGTRFSIMFNRQVFHFIHILITTFSISSEKKKKSTLDKIRRHKRVWGRMKKKLTTKKTFVIYEQKFMELKRERERENFQKKQSTNIIFKFFRVECKQLFSTDKIMQICRELNAIYFFFFLWSRHVVKHLYESRGESYSK